MCIIFVRPKWWLIDSNRIEIHSDVYTRRCGTIEQQDFKWFFSCFGISGLFARSLKYLTWEWGTGWICIVSSCKSPELLWGAMGLLLGKTTPFQARWQRWRRWCFWSFMMMCLLRFFSANFNPRKRTNDMWPIIISVPKCDSTLPVSADMTCRTCRV